MGLPELTFTLKKAAETVSTRISRGAVALILRDAKANGVHVVCQESDIPTTLGADNIAYIKRTLMGYINRPSAVYVSVVPAAGTIAAGFSALAAYTYDYIAGPSDISAEDATALAALVKERRKLRYIGKAVLPNTAADYEGVINFVSAGIAAGGKTAFSAAAYCSRIAGMLAGTPAQCSATYAQLSEAAGAPVIFTLQALPYGRVQDISRLEQDAELQILLAGCIDPDLKSTPLQHKFGGITPAETLKAMLLPGEIADLSREVERLSGYRRATIEKVKNA